MRSQSERADPPLEETAIEAPGKRPGLALDPYRVTLVLKRGWKWIAGAAALGVIFATFVPRLLVPDQYVAELTLKYEGYPGAERHNPGDVNTLAEAFHLDPVLADVKTRAHLAVPAAGLRGRISVEPDISSGIVRARVSGRSGVEAAHVATAAGDAFMAYHRGRQERRLRDELERVEKRLEAAQASLGGARQEYDAFREQHGITDLSNEQERGIESAARLGAERDMTQSEIRALEARVEQLRRDVRGAPRMVVTSSGSSLEARQLAQTETELGEARSSLSENHPRVQALEQRIATLRLRLAAGQTTSAGSDQLGASATRSTLETALSQAQADLEAARRRLGSLEGLATAAQTRVSDFSEVEGDASTLLARVRVHEQLAGELEGQRAQLQDLVREPPSGFRLVTAPIAPEEPVPSRRKKILGLGLPIFALALAIGILLARELRGLRVRTATEVGFWGNGPVIGSTTWPREPRAIDDLVADLDDLLPDKSCHVLVAPANEKASELSREVAHRLRDDWTGTRLIGSSTAPLHAQARPISSRPPPRKTPTPQGSAIAPQIVVPAAAPLPQGSTALVRRSDADALRDHDPRPKLEVHAWEGPVQGQALRRAARLADKVLVVVPVGDVSATDLVGAMTRLGRSDGVGFIVVNVPHELAHRPDRVGNVEGFWSARRA